MEQTKQVQQNLSLDSWEGFLGKKQFLKATEKDVEKKTWVIVGVAINTDTARPQLLLDNGVEPIRFELNVVNSQKLLDLGGKSPNLLVGRKINFRKVWVRNPETGKEVESLRIEKLE